MIFWAGKQKAISLNGTTPFAIENGNRIASISKELLNFTDAYVLDVATPADALYVLMFVLAVDAEKLQQGLEKNEKRT